MSNPLTRKSCVVPKCTNTTIKTPEKLFFRVPNDPKVRRKWLNAAKRADPVAAKSCVYCCEDHFDIETDMENYTKYKLVGGNIKLKKGVVPHKFACQKDTTDNVQRSVVEKRNKLKLINKVLTEKYEDVDVSTTPNPEVILIALPNNEETEDPLGLTAVNHDQHSQTSKKHNKSQQVHLKKKVRSKGTNTEEIIFCTQQEKEIPNLRKVTQYQNMLPESSFSSEADISNDVSFEVNNNMLNYKDFDSTFLSSDDSECEKTSFKNYMQKAALWSISREPQLLLGLPKSCYFCISLLAESVNCNPRDIMITLKKIRLHQPNAILALDFGLSMSSIASIVRRTVPLIASCMKSLIFFPPSMDVLINLPLTFRRRYHKVQGIIDCFEIQMEKPSDSIKQSLTWSDYKGGNTIKYLISISPDGFINYISEGYGGRATDSAIFEDCGILDVLPKGAAVLADRGFKNVSHLLEQKGCTLIRPPSVSTQITPSKKEVLETKKIAALRIHVERSIGRLRNFGFMLPHACVDVKQVDLLDSIVVTACGIVNLQSPLFDTT